MPRKPSDVEKDLNGTTDAGKARGRVYPEVWGAASKLGVDGSRRLFRDSEQQGRRIDPPRAIPVPKVFLAVRNELDCLRPPAARRMNDATETRHRSREQAALRQFAIGADFSTQDPGIAKPLHAELLIGERAHARLTTDPEAFTLPKLEGLSEVLHRAHLTRGADVRTSAAPGLVAAC